MRGSLLISAPISRTLGSMRTSEPPTAPERPNIVRAIFEETAALGGKTALVEKDRTLTYGALAEGVERLARELRARDVRPLDRVAFLCPDSIDYVLLSLAILSLDAAIVPISPGLMSDECATLIAHLDVRHFLADETCAPDKTAGDPFRTADLARAFRWTTRVPARPDPAGYAEIRPAFIRFSSGTTGASKGVVLSHETILDRTDAANDGLRITAADVVGWVLSMSFHFVVTILLFLRKGATIVLCGDPLPQALEDALRAHRLTFLYASPIHYRLLAESAAPAPEHFAAVRMAVSTAIQLPEAIARRFHERFGLRLTEAYGIIEVGLPFIHAPQTGGHDGSLGAPLPAYAVKLAETGEVLIRGKGMCDAYFSPWQPAHLSRPDGWFHTGDLGELRADGTLKLIGRCKAVINFSGMKVFPQEVEDVLNQFPGVAESLVYGEPHPEFGQLPCAKLVLKEGAGAFDEKALRAFCRAHLAIHKIPKTFACVPALPKTASGKLRRA